MNPFWVLLGKDSADILREKSIIASFAVQAMVAGFSTILVVGLTALFTPASVGLEVQLPVAYVGGDLPVGEGFDGVMAEAGLRLARTNATDAAARLDEASVAGIVAERLEGGRRHVTVTVPEGSAPAMVLVPTLRELLQDYERGLRNDDAGALTTPVLPLPDAPEGLALGAMGVSLITPILVLLPAFIGGAIAGDSWTREKQTRTLMLLRASPVSPWQIVAGKTVVPVLLVPMQAALWLLVLRLGGTQVHNVPVLLLFATVYALYMAGLAIGVAALSRNTVHSQTGYAVIVLVSLGMALFLPRDPLNAVALVAHGDLLPSVWRTLGVLAAAAVAVFALGVVLVRRSLHSDA